MENQLDLSLSDNLGTETAPVAAEQLSPYRLRLRSGIEYAPSADEITRLKAAYPNVDVCVELQRMSLWLDNNPTRRKTAKGINRFIQTWLSRAQGCAPKVNAFNSTGKTYVAEGTTNW